MWLVNLDSGSITVKEKGILTPYDLKKDLGMGQDVQPLGHFYAALYIDRLGFRYHVEDDHSFFGTKGYAPPIIHELNLRTPRIGVDLDLVRYSFAKLGINYDYHMRPVKFSYRTEDTDDDGVPETCTYKPERAMTIGAHGQVIPIRLRGVPLIFDARVRFPIPFLDDYFRPEAAKIVDWEVSGGMRPAVWDMSEFGLGTFSTAIELGYESRMLHVKMEDPTLELDAHWQGAFFRLAVFY